MDGCYLAHDIRYVGVTFTLPTKNLHFETVSSRTQVLKVPYPNLDLDVNSCLRVLLEVARRGLCGAEDGTDRAVGGRDAADGSDDDHLPAHHLHPAWLLAVGRNRWFMRLFVKKDYEVKNI